MATIANLLIKLGVDTSEADTKLTGFGSKASGALKKGFVPALAVLGGVGVMAKKVADDASNLAESQNAVGVVFGKSASIVDNFSKVAAKQAGLSMTELNSLVVPLGAGLRNAGFSADAAAKSSVNLAKRAADMASVFNTSVPEALEAIQSGLRGEADPLEKFGVGLNEAAVNAKAVSMGLAKTTAEVGPNAKAQARLALIMEQTSKYQGDFVRTSDQAANKARINRAEQANLRAELGRGLLPVMSTLQGIMASVTGLMARHTTTVKVATIAVTSLAAAVVAINLVMRTYTALTAAAAAIKSVFVRQTAVATAATGAQTVAQQGLNAAMRANVLGIVVTALAALAAGLVIAYQKSETFRNIVNAAFSAVGAAAGKLRDAIGWVIDKGQTLFSWGGWKLILGVIGGPLLLIATNAGKVRDAIGWIVDKAKVLYAWGGWGVIASVIGAPFKAIGAAADKVADAIGWVLDKGKAIYNWGGWKTLGGIIAAPFSAAIGAINSVVSAINSVISKAQAAISAIGRVKSAFSGGSDPSKSFVVPGTVTRYGKSIPAGATGGIVTRPTLALIGEAGPEAVVPLNQTPGSSPLPRNLGGGGPTVNVETMVVQDATDVDLLVSRLGRRLAMGMV